LITSVLTSKSNCKKCRLMQRCQYLSDCKCMELENLPCIVLAFWLGNWSERK